MRRSLIPVVAAVFAFACSEAPIAPLLSTPAPPSFAFSFDYPPPPFAVVDGTVTSEYGTFSFVGHFFANKPGNVAWLSFQSASAGVTLSPNARIMSVNGTVSGVGTISLNGGTIQLNQIETFNYQTYRTTGAISFGGGGIRQGSAKAPGIDIGDGGACYNACYVDVGNRGK